MDFQATRNLLSQGETGKALTTLIDALKQDGRFKQNFLRTLLLLEGKYNAVRQKELGGILPFQEAQREYNQINDAIFTILDDLEAGRIPSEVMQARVRNIVLAIMGVGVVVLGVFALVRVFGAKENPCPVFEKENAWHVLIIPFDSLSEISSRVEVRIQDGINKFTQKAEIAAEVRIAQKRWKDVTSLDIADSLGRECNAGLVIYGQYLAYSKDSLRVNLGLRNLKAGGKTASLPFKTYRDITEVGNLRDLEDALLAVCSMIAIEEDKWEFAARWMDKIKEKDSEEVAMSEWLGQQLKKKKMESGN